MIPSKSISLARGSSGLWRASFGLWQICTVALMVVGYAGYYLCRSDFSVSLPLIIDHGQLNPLLNDSSQWGYTLGNAVRVWRTGAGIDRHGNLIYAAADYQTVTTLAQILQRAGAVRAMQLDINPEWPTLNTYGHHGGLDPAMVVPNYQQSASRYLVPDDRDFFAVYRRLPGRITVPFK